MPLKIDAVRQNFPALWVKDKGKSRIYLDNPGGTQVPKSVINQIEQYLIQRNANHGGFFKTSRESDKILDETHQAMADFLNASSPKEIIFGPNMTTLTFAISRSLAKWFTSGDEIILTRMEHDGNIAPWYQMARDNGLIVKWLNFNIDNFRFDLNDVEDLITDRVRLIAINYASNALGTINDIKSVIQIAHDRNILVYVDGVHYVPHAPTDVQDLDCDFFVCSAYKFFGPHLGILWGKYELLDKLAAYKVRPADDYPPGKFETGTQSHEGEAGTLGALDYLTGIGESMAREFYQKYDKFEGRRKYLHAAMLAIKEYERVLSEHLINGLKKIPGVHIYGITNHDELDDRVPTVSFVIEGMHPSDIAKSLARQNIFVWNGNFYAVEVVKHLGLEDKGGLLRVGAVHYNTNEEINLFLSHLDDLAKKIY